MRGKAARGEVPAGAPAGSGTPVERAGDADEGYGTKLSKCLISGVSYMVPFVAAGGLLIALGFAIGGYEIKAVGRPASFPGSWASWPTD